MKNYLKKAAILGSLLIAGGIYTDGTFNNNNPDYEKSIYEAYESSKLERILKRKKRRGI